MELEKQKRFLIRFCYYFVIVALAFVFIKYVYPLVSPFFVAFFVAFILRRPMDFLAKKLKIRRSVIAVALIILFYAVIGGLLSLVVVKLFLEVKELFFRLPGIYTEQIAPFLMSLTGQAEQTMLRIDPATLSTIRDILSNAIESIGSAISNFSVGVVGVISGYATSVPGILIKIVLTIIASFFISVDYHKLTRFIHRHLTPRGNLILSQSKEYVSGTLFRIVRSYFFIMCITFSELTVGLLLVGIKNAVLVAAIIALLDIIPVLGTGGVLIPWMLISLLQGNVTQAIGLLIVYVVIFIVRQVIEPKIVGQQVGLHPVIILVSMFTGVQIFGGIGLFLLPILISLAQYLYQNGTIGKKNGRSL